MSKEELIKYHTHTFQMNVDCDGCEAKVRKILHRVDGVCEVVIERGEKVTVKFIGNVDSSVLMNKLSKSGKIVKLLNNQAQNQKQPSGDGNQTKNNVASADMSKGGGGNQANKINAANTKQPKGGQGQQANPNPKQLPQAASAGKNLKNPIPPNQKAMQFANSKADNISGDESDDGDDSDEDSESSSTKSRTPGKPGSKTSSGSVGAKGVAGDPQLSKMTPNPNSVKKGPGDGGNGGVKNEGRGSSGVNGSNSSVANPNQTNGKKVGGGRPHVDGGFPPNNVNGFPPNANPGFPANVNAGFPPNFNGGFPPNLNGGLPPNANCGLPPIVNGGFPPHHVSVGFTPHVHGGIQPYVNGSPPPIMAPMAPNMNQLQGPMGHGPLRAPPMYDGNQRDMYMVSHYPPQPQPYYPAPYQEHYSSVFSDENPVSCAVL